MVSGNLKVFRQKEDGSWKKIRGAEMQNNFQININSITILNEYLKDIVQ